MPHERGTARSSPAAPRQHQHAVGPAPAERRNRPYLEQLRPRRTRPRPPRPSPEPSHPPRALRLAMATKTAGYAQRIVPKTDRAAAMAPRCAQHPLVAADIHSSTSIRPAPRRGRPQGDMLTGRASCDVSRRRRSDTRRRPATAGRHRGRGGERAGEPTSARGRRLTRHLAENSRVRQRASCATPGAGHPAHAAPPARQARRLEREAQAVAGHRVDEAGGVPASSSPGQPARGGIDGQRAQHGHRRHQRRALRTGAASSGIGGDRVRAIRRSGGLLAARCGASRTTQTLVIRPGSGAMPI